MVGKLRGINAKKKMFSSNVGFILSLKLSLSNSDYVNSFGFGCVDDAVRESMQKASSSGSQVWDSSFGHVHDPSNGVF